MSPASAAHERRLSAQLLSGPPARDPISVAQRLLAIQGQDPRGARLAIRARTRGVSAADVDRELNAGRMLITWLNRGTLHLVTSDDHPLLQALTTPPLVTSSRTRLAQLGIDDRLAERGLVAIERALADEGPLTGQQLRDHVDQAGVPTADQGLIQLLFAAAIRGLVVRGPMVGRQHAYVLVRDWLDAAPAPRRDCALAELARRYLQGHGPAADRDLARWAGLPLRDARAGLSAISTELRTDRDGLVDLKRVRRTVRPVPPRLLGAFEPLLLGWRSRADILGAHEGRVVAGGVFRGFAMIGGRAAGCWRIVGRRVLLEPFGKLQDGDGEALARDGDAVLAFLGLT